MTLEGRAYVIRVLADELDVLTPGRSTTRAANEALAAEFVDEHNELVDATTRNARQPDGDLNPWRIDRELTDLLVDHCRNRIRPRTWEAR